ncbi:TetR/AcrR family transcriptional regulator [Wohlfahrtiimonas larvae]|uniref:TetR-like C-terminal domain-containing protein n=1 Tax=Wohlfahrtiimonas larvae TaxID=1157986 RepID=A0ABP9MP42_9GAMM|nr:TetR/AcrR family transcriptional regulator [Wohlfahrtiimonas larvae]
MGRRNDHSRDELKEMIIVAAEKILVEEGYGKLTTRRIAKEIGYTVGSLYMVIKNVDDLMLLLNARTLQLLLAKIEGDLTERDLLKPYDALMQIAVSYVDFAFEHKEKWQAIFMHRVTDSALLTEEYFIHIRNLFKVISYQLSLLAPKSNEDELELLTRGLWGAVHGVTMLSLDHKFSIGSRMEYDTKRVVEGVVSNALYGIQNRS